jgi:hypothetical protein
MNVLVKQGRLGEFDLVKECLAAIEQEIFLI